MFMARQALYAIIISWLFAASAAFAVDVRYQVLGYGEEHAVLILKGVTPNSVTASMGSDGMTIRISGVDVRFIQVEGQGSSALITGVNQLKRGAYTDLVLALSSPSELKATPTAQDLRLLVKKKGAADKLPSLVKNQESKDAAIDPKKALPVKVGIEKEAGEGSKSQAVKINISCPDISSLSGISSLSEGLRKAAAMFDLIVAWSVGRSLEDETENSLPKQIETLTKEKADLEGLVQNLTQELENVRKDLSSKDDELKKLQGGAK